MPYHGKRPQAGERTSAPAVSNRGSTKLDVTRCTRDDTSPSGVLECGNNKRSSVWPQGHHYGDVLEVRNVCPQHRFDAGKRVMTVNIIYNILELMVAQTGVHALY